MGAGALEKVIQVKGHPRQIACVLQKGEEREKDRHGGQHHRHHPGHGPVHAVHQGPLQPPGGAQGVEQPPQRLLPPHKQLGEQLRGQVCPRHGQPQHCAQQQQHHRNARGPGGEEPVDGPVPPVGGLLIHGHNLPCQPDGPGHGGGRLALLAARTAGTAGGLQGTGRWIGRCLLQRLAQLLQPLAAAGGGPHHRHAQPAAQGGEVHLDSLFCRLVQ